MNERARRIIKRIIDKTPTPSSPKIAGILSRDYGLTVCTKTLRRAIHRTGYKAYYRKKKPHITKKNKEARLEYARKYLNEPQEFWNRVLFTDESKYNIFGYDGKLKVWRASKQGLNPKYTIGTVKHGGGGLMVCGCMAANGVGNLEFINGTMDHILYINILKDNLKASTDKLGLPGNFVFQLDNDRKHTAQNDTPRVMKSPAQSPDLNTIEHLWEHLERMIRDREMMGKNVFELPYKRNGLKLDQR